ncbi:MAG: LicD family protein [bacterium]|nr:LicD family protein [bacterium]
MENNNDCIKDREDYVICEKNGIKITARQLQLEGLTIMDEIHRVCEKNNIKYALIAGSALGIVNYKGFIPWDDDIDLCILRKDWNRFIDALNKDLSDNFYFQCFENDKNFNTINGPTMKIRKKNTYIKESNFLLKNRCKSGDGIFVDVIIYDNVNENKFIDELCRTVIKIIMPFIVFLDNLHINPIHLKKFVVWFSNIYSRKCENSKLMSQPISVPWEKFLHEPVFLKEDILPFKLYDFEGRKYYSYNNIEKILKEWYGPNCLKKWDGEKWIEPYPIEKRKPKHTVDLNLNGSDAIEK